MTCIDRNEISGIELHPQFFASSGLLVLKRTDFDEQNLIDYAMGTTEYSTLTADHRLELLEHYRKKTDTPLKLEEWTDGITSMAIGLISRTLFWTSSWGSALKTSKHTNYLTSTS